MRSLGTTSFFAMGAAYALSGCSLTVSLEGLDQADAGSGGAASSGQSAESGQSARSGQSTFLPPTSGTSSGGSSSSGSLYPTPFNDAGGGGDLVAFYPFDESSGTVANDESGYGRSATLSGGATFATGILHNAVSLNGSGQYVTLPSGIVSGLTSFSITTWVYLNSAPTWTHIFEFGTGTNAYMALTAMSDTKTLRFSITSGGFFAEQHVESSPLSLGSWQHVAFTLSGHTGVLYVNGAPAGQNTGIMVTPASLGTTGENWIGRSPYTPDPYLNGRIDEFQIYDVALTAAQVAVLAGKP